MAAVEANEYFEKLWRGDQQLTENKDDFSFLCWAYFQGFRSILNYFDGKGWIEAGIKEKDTAKEDSNKNFDRYQVTDADEPQKTLDVIFAYKVKDKHSAVYEKPSQEIGKRIYLPPKVGVWVYAYLMFGKASQPQDAKQTRKTVQREAMQAMQSTGFFTPKYRKRFFEALCPNHEIKTYLEHYLFIAINGKMTKNKESGGWIIEGCLGGKSANFSMEKGDAFTLKGRVPTGIYKILQKMNEALTGKISCYQAILKIKEIAHSRAFEKNGRDQDTMVFYIAIEAHIHALLEDPGIALDAAEANKKFSFSLKEARQAFNEGLADQSAQSAQFS